jgi:hypothetical protein
LGACRTPDEGAGFAEVFLDVAPSAHHDLQLRELRCRLGAGKRDQACPMGTYRCDLGGVVLDAPIARDDQPVLGRDLGQPVLPPG